MARKASRYFVPLVLLPTIIRKPGQYVTRCGEVVTVNDVSDEPARNHSFDCIGAYIDRIPDCIEARWHRSGRLLAHRKTQNDIIRPA